ncbi:MAG: hypothetical protein U0325_00650 [Polyangiales bacterium]
MSGLLPGALALLLTACPSTPVVTDGGSDVGAAVDAVDAGGATDAGGSESTDAGGSGPTDAGGAVDVTDGGATMFTPCTSNTDCGEGGRCNRDYPGGICSRSCRNSADCGNNGGCYQGACRPRCRTETADCVAYSGLCFVTDPEGAASRMGLCFPSCAEVPAPGQAACSTGRVCNPYTGLCATSAQVVGAPNGSPCAMGTDCASGRCRPEFIDAPGMPMQFTGFVGGYCVSLTIRPPDSAFAEGMPLPRGGCPMGSTVGPATGKPMGFTTQCWQQCTRNSECREGYQCQMAGDTGMPRHSTGVCLPIDCSQMGSTCPAGRRCDLRSGMSQDGMTFMYGLCVRDAGDGGVPDGGSDASVADGGQDSGTLTDAGARAD